MADCCIYGLHPVGSSEYFYVGSTNKPPHQRLREHLYAVASGHHLNRHFVNKINKIGPEHVEIAVLAVTDEQHRWDLEKQWIGRLISDGCKLVNRIHNELDYQIQSHTAYRIPKERWLKAVALASMAAPKAANPRMQEVANLAHALLKEVVDSALRNGVFPLPEWEYDSGTSAV